MQFISSELVFEAMQREARCNLGDPMITALDIARGGDDEVVLATRRGLDGRHKPMYTLPGSEAKDSMQLASYVTTFLEREKPDAFVFDGVGVGGPVGDRIRQLGYATLEFKGSAKSPNKKYGNMRAYSYGKLRDWLESGGALPDDPELESQLTSVEYFHNRKDQFRQTKSILHE